MAHTNTAADSQTPTQRDTASHSQRANTPDTTTTSRFPKWVLWLAAIATLYMLIVSIDLIGAGFKGLGADTAKGLFDFATNPFVGLFVGILATAMIQSSSTTTAIVVTAVGTGALPINIAVPIIMGANAGTSVTNTLAALGMVAKKEPFRRAFAASTVHDFFNLMAIIVLLPIELIFHPIERSAHWVAAHLYGTVLPDPDNADFLSAIVDPVSDALGMKGLLSILPGSDTVAALATMVLGVVMIFLAVNWMGKILQTIMVGRAKAILERSVGGNPITSMGAGFLVTVAAQSSSVTTSIMVPFAGAGTLTTREIYPMTLGANVGTTATALIAALAISGPNAESALTIALVHTLFNVYGIFILYVLPFFRSWPINAAEFLAKVATERKILAFAWVICVFILIPACGIAVQAVVG